MEHPVTIPEVDTLTILNTLPHRYPFLLIDRVIDIRGDQGGIGIKNVSVNEPQFTGHFPSRPIYPGVLMIEGMAQTAGIIGLLSMGDLAPKAVYFVTIDKCKFRKPVGPGDTIHYHMNRIARRKEMWWFHGDAKVNGEIVAQADVSAMLAD
ncbi:MAG TPA: 3-hydroxyacyl-ACP dehydratase FabZ [Rhizobium sp.]